MPYNFIDSAYPVFLLLIVLEGILIQRNHSSAFSWKETLSSLGIAIGYRISNVLFGFIPFVVYSFVWQHRLFTMPLNKAWAMLLLFFGIEFCYYWHHRLAHKIRWMWATHAVHHSAKHLNLSAAFRLGWTGWLSGNFLFLIPLLLIGFHPVAVTIGLALNLVSQLWIHTELIPKLGWLEGFLNTPSHHRVHHASNLEYIDRNFGGILIIFDRWFGTFTEENSAHPPVYGLTHPIRSLNPVAIAFHEWGRLLQDFGGAKNWRDRTSVLFGLPK
jgi:sterol desaturase/sphingolipid hydroxylase (fatty acid hydroxylase superfamily)